MIRPRPESSIPVLGRPALRCQCRGDARAARDDPGSGPSARSRRSCDRSARLSVCCALPAGLLGLLRGLVLCAIRAEAVESGHGRCRGPAAGARPERRSACRGADDEPVGGDPARTVGAGEAVGRGRTWRCTAGRYPPRPGDSISVRYGRPLPEQATITVRFDEDCRQKPTSEHWTAVSSTRPPRMTRRGRYDDRPNAHDVRCRRSDCALPSYPFEVAPIRGQGTSSMRRPVVVHRMRLSTGSVFSQVTGLHCDGYPLMLGGWHTTRRSAHKGRNWRRSTCRPPEWKSSAVTGAAGTANWI